MNYRFSAGIVYNNFQWPLAATAEQRQAIEEAAQAVLDVRVKYPVSSLADHLNGTMPPDLFKARQKLDAAVDAAFSKKKFSSDTDYVAFLFELYQQILPGMIAPALLDAAAAGLKRPAMRRKRLYQIKRTDCAFARLRRYRDILQNARHPRNVTKSGQDVSGQLHQIGGAGR